MTYNKEERSIYRKNLWHYRRNEWFSSRPCVSCGSIENLNLDHIDPSIKESHNIWLWSDSRRQAELAKCQSLCETCHKKKTKLERSKSFTHGVTTAGYVKGCRCSLCLEAHLAYQREWRKKRKLLNLPYK
jgi:5-methylcytosine-specific restriction endonuclease McrA